MGKLFFWNKKKKTRKKGVSKNRTFSWPSETQGRRRREKRFSICAALFSFLRVLDWPWLWDLKMTLSKSRPFNSITYALTSYLEEMLSSLGWEDDGEEGESSWAASVVGVGTVKWSVKIFNFLGVPSPIGLNSNKDPARERERERVCIQTEKNLHSVNFSTPWTKPWIRSNLEVASQRKESNQKNKLYIFQYQF